ncbi:hypothetical protein B0H15DRAFT_922380 [Mycena belliarum]|uniref:Uncharacterized protein n=1 Tax=Mycena belliarum TaxID=1033014 RepID=A0AAD6U4Y0_9AGAR|nr:hypothetical protein B0H15DRAFT_922380 [Mycena belliae]
MLSLSAALQLATHLALATAQVAYTDPRSGGGRMLTVQNEPLNIIVSGLSSPEVLSTRGIVNFGNAIGYGDDCFGIHLGGPQAADLGDGNGLREDFGSKPIGTCLETLIGGNHYRVFRQNGGRANTGALFLAASKEESVTEHHDIVPNGDQVVSEATGGKRSFSSIDYTSTVTYVDGLLAPGAEGINHNIAIDGRVAILTITATTDPVYVAG